MGCSESKHQEWAKENNYVKMDDNNEVSEWLKNTESGKEFLSNVCPACDYSNYKTLNEYNNLQSQLNALKNSNSKPSCDYSNYKTLNEYNNLQSQLDALKRSNSDLSVVKSKYDELEAKYKSQLEDLKKSSVEKSKYDELEAKYKSKDNCECTKNQMNDLNSKIANLTKERDAANSAKSKLNTELAATKKSLTNLQDSLKASEYESWRRIGDFQKYLGKWFMIVSKAKGQDGKERHISTDGRHNGGGNVVMRAGINPANDYFTVDAAGHIICKSNHNSILAVGKWNNYETVRVVGKDWNEGKDERAEWWLHEHGLGYIWSSVHAKTGGKKFHWEFPNTDKANEGGTVIIHNDQDDQVDYHWEIRVVEPFTVLDKLTDNIKRIIVLIVLFVAGLYILVKYIYSDKFENQDLDLYGVREQD